MLFFLSAIIFPFLSCTIASSSTIYDPTTASLPPPFNFWGFYPPSQLLRPYLPHPNLSTFLKCEKQQSKLLYSNTFILFIIQNLFWFTSIFLQHFSQRRVALGFTLGILVSVALMSVPSLKLYEGKFLLRLWLYSLSNWMMVCYCYADVCWLSQRPPTFSIAFWSVHDVWGVSRCRRLDLFRDGFDRRFRVSGDSHRRLQRHHHRRHSKAEAEGNSVPGASTVKRRGEEELWPGRAESTLSGHGETVQTTFPTKPLLIDLEESLVSPHWCMGESTMSCQGEEEL